MKRSGFKQKSFKEVKEKLLKKQAVKREYNKLGKLKSRTPLKSHTSPKVKSKRKTKEKTQASLKKDLDAIFSIYIRTIFPKVCYTCNKPSDRLQCGHFISRQYLVTRWSVDNCRPQCWGCNGYGKGQTLIFEENLKREYGNDFVEAMKASRHQTMKVDRVWYREQIEMYKKKLSTAQPLHS